MAKRINNTYMKNDHVRRAALFNCRIKDLQPGGRIERGQIVKGLHGYAVAEHEVPEVSAEVVSYMPNGRCQWSIWELDCLYLPGSPKNKNLKGRNYIVAELTTEEMHRVAIQKCIPVIELSDGRKLVNLEIDRFSNQTVERRADLI